MHAAPHGYVDSVVGALSYSDDGTRPTQVQRQDVESCELTLDKLAVLIPAVLNDRMGESFSQKIKGLEKARIRVAA